jgi:hypothetical protein
MSWLRRHEKLAVLLAMLVVSAVYSLPQYSRIFGGQPEAVYIQWDESFYFGRVIRAMQGHWFPGDGFVIEHAGTHSGIPTLFESAIGGAAHVWNSLAPRMLEISPSAVLIALRTVFPPSMFLALFLGLRVLGMGAGLAIFAAAIAFVDPSNGQLRPFWTFPLFSVSALPFSRVISPMMNVALFFAAWAATARALLVPVPPRRWVVGGGVLAGLLFYTSFYYWTHLGLTLLLTCLMMRDSRRWRTFLVGMGIALAISVPYWIFYAGLSHDPNYPHWVWLSGLATRSRNTWVLTHKTLWLSLLAMAPLAFSKDERKRLLFISAVSGVLLYLSPLVTGVDGQAWHWMSYTTAPLIIVTVIWSGAEFLRERLEKYHRIWLAVQGVAALHLCATLVYGGAVSFRQYGDWVARAKDAPEQGFGDVDREVSSAWSWLKSHAAPGSVVLASRELMPLVPIRTGLWAWYDNHFLNWTVGMDEIFERTMVAWKLEGKSEAQARETYLGSPLALACSICFGAPPKFFGYLNSGQALKDGLAPGTPGLRERMWEEGAGYYATLTDARVAEIGRKFRLDYLLLRAGESEVNYARYLRLALAQDAGGGVRIFRIDGWK